MAVPILGKRDPRGMFMVAGRCPTCDFPLFVHEILGSYPPERSVLPFCQHGGVEVDLRIPTVDEPFLESKSLEHLFRLIYQQQDMLAEVMARLVLQEGQSEA